MDDKLLKVLEIRLEKRCRDAGLYILDPPERSRRAGKCRIAPGQPCVNVWVIGYGNCFRDPAITASVAFDEREPSVKTGDIFTVFDDRIGLAIKDLWEQSLRLDWEKVLKDEEATER